MVRRSKSAAFAHTLALGAACALFQSQSGSNASQGFLAGMSTVRGVARAPAIARQSEKTAKIVDLLKELTLLEASELARQIEDAFGGCRRGAREILHAGPRSDLEDGGVWTFVREKNKTKQCVYVYMCTCQEGTSLVRLVSVPDSLKK